MTSAKQQAADSAAEPIRAVVGLGNPGRDYEGTRHNVGFEIVDRLAREAGSTWKREKKWQAEVARAGSVLLIKPQTFMNRSGQTVSSVCGFFKMPPSQVLVVYDDNDLALGTLRFRANGSAGGHNGIKSILQSLGSDRFPRLKFGIGRRPPEGAEEGAPGAAGPRGGAMIGHVLGRFAASEEEDLQKFLAIAVDAVNCALARGLAVAMNQFNQKPKKARKKSRPKSSEQAADLPAEAEIPPPSAATQHHPKTDSQT